MSSLTNAIRAEHTKVQGSRSWWIMLLILFGYSALMAGFIAFFVGDLGTMSGQAGVELDPVTSAKLTYTIGSSLGYVIPVIFGTLLFTAEIRYHTLTPTFLATPKRSTVLLAKVVIAKGYGLLFGLAAALGAALPAAIIFSLQGKDTQLGNPEILWMLVRIVIVMAIWSLLGLGLGSLVTNQITAIVLLLAFTQFLEPILRMVSAIWDWSAQLGQFLPGAASDSFVGAGILNSMSQLDPTLGSASAHLDWWAGGLVLLALAVVMMLFGYLSNWRKDVS
ncbi:MAG: ABC transporter permease [Microbacteriaceae bacterium]